MSRIDQLYATHCTYGTSALDRREGEMSDRVLGYSARASSLQSQDLRRHYRTVERYLYYNVPSDAPAEQKLILTPAEAPRRLIFVPSVSGMQMLAQVCYRQWDAAHKSPGSYFAHVLLGKRDGDGSRWSMLRCLQLYGAPLWTIEDGPALPIDLTALYSPYDAAGVCGALNDEAVANFLGIGDGAEAPGDLIGDRWRAMSVDRRRSHFETALRGLLDVAPRRRESVMLVIEPSVSVVFFYGLARLLPPTLRDELSFSTYETNVDRLCTTLAALTFHSPQTTDIKAERYQRGGFVLNTYKDKHTTLPPRQSAYATAAMAALLEGGWQEVDRLHRAFEAAGGKTYSDLEDYGQLELTAAQVVSPPTPIEGDIGERLDRKKRDYLIEAAGRRLASTGQPQWQAILDSPDHLKACLSLLASRDFSSESPPDWYAALRWILHRLPASQLDPFLSMEKATAVSKVEALSAYISRHGQLPPGCERLLLPLGTKPAMRQRCRLTAVLRHLDGESVERFQVPPDMEQLFFLHLSVACGDDEKKASLLAGMAEEMTGDEAAALVKELGPAAGGNERLQRIFSEKLLALLNRLHRTPSQLKERLQLLEPGRALLGEAASRFDGWRKLVDILHDTRAKADQKPALWQRLKSANEDPSELFGQRLTIALLDAAPIKKFPEFTSDRRAVCLQEAAASFGLTSQLPQNLPYKIEQFQQFRRWHASAKVERRARYTTPLAIMAGSLGFALLFLIVAFALRPSAATSSTDRQTAGAADSARGESSAAGNASASSSSGLPSLGAISRLIDQGEYRLALARLDEIPPAARSSEINEIQSSAVALWLNELEPQIVTDIDRRKYQQAIDSLQSIEGHVEGSHKARWSQLREKVEHSWLFWTQRMVNQAIERGDYAVAREWLSKYHGAKQDEAAELKRRIEQAEQPPPEEKAKPPKEPAPSPAKEKPAAKTPDEPSAPAPQVKVVTDRKSAQTFEGPPPETAPSTRTSIVVAELTDEQRQNLRAIDVVLPDGPKGSRMVVRSIDRKPDEVTVRGRRLGEEERLTELGKFHLTSDGRLKCTISWSGDVEVEQLQKNLRHCKVRLEFADEIWECDLRQARRASAERVARRRTTLPKRESPAPAEPKPGQAREVVVEQVEASQNIPRPPQSNSSQPELFLLLDRDKLRDEKINRFEVTTPPGDGTIKFFSERDGDDSTGAVAVLVQWPDSEPIHLLRYSLNERGELQCLIPWLPWSLDWRIWQLKVLGNCQVKVQLDGKTWVIENR